jgi:hypothetical protein
MIYPPPTASTQTKIIIQHRYLEYNFQTDFLIRTRIVVGNEDVSLLVDDSLKIGPRMNRVEYI